MCRQFTELKKSSRSFYLCSCLVEVFFEAVNLFGDLFGDLLLLLRVVETFSPVDDLLGDLLRLPAADVGFFPRRFFLMSLGSISSCL